MTLSEYLASLTGKTVAVIGCGVSNRPLLRRLAASRAKVCAYDRKTREELGEFADELDALGITLFAGPDYLEKLHGDIIFRTPGLRPDIPQILRAVDAGAVLTSEMEVFFDVCPCPIYAVTGSDGKTTTSTLIAEMLTGAGFRCHLGGNIGRPLLCSADEITPEDRVVVELSSFQLMTMKKAPAVAVVTNVAPNHLDVHRDMDEYVAAKRNVFLYQNAAGRVVLNHENGITRSFADEAQGNVLFFSKTDIPGDGAYLKDGVIHMRARGEDTAVLSAADIRIPGMHNVENYMAAIAAVWGSVPAEGIRTLARSFGGVEHRIEFVRQRRGVRYYNDSIASSPTRTIAGLHAFAQKIILIAGGYDKKIPFEPLAPEICAHVRILILCGATAGKIRAAVEACPAYKQDTPAILEADTLEQAVALAAGAAEAGDIVSLSPACAAFDQFPNFAVRGRTFKEYVRALPE
jgi:UDP-N-acetylmuramoylalanine--D-glutamate ligase